MPGGLFAFGEGGHAVSRRLPPDSQVKRDVGGQPQLRDEGVFFRAVKLIGPTLLADLHFYDSLC